MVVLLFSMLLISSFENQFIPKALADEVTPSVRETPSLSCRKFAERRAIRHSNADLRRIQKEMEEPPLPRSQMSKLIETNSIDENEEFTETDTGTYVVWMGVYNSCTKAILVRTQAVLIEQGKYKGTVRCHIVEIDEYIEQECG